jgi:hypothetical protein
MKKMLLTLALLLTFVQAASAVVLDTVWYKQLNTKCFFATFSPDTNKIIAAMDSTIYYLDSHTGAVIDSFQKIPIPAHISSMSFNKKRFAAGSYIWDTTTKSIIKNFHVNGNDTNYIVGINALSPEGRYLVCKTSVINKHPNQNNPYDTSRILVYDLDADTVVKWIDINDNLNMRYIAYSPDGNSFVISYDVDASSHERGWGKLVKYRTSDWQEDKVLENDYRSGVYYTYLSFSSDGRYMAGTKIDTSGGSNYIWDMSADTVCRAYSKNNLGGYTYAIINFSSNDNYLLFGSGSPFVDGKPHNQIWDFVNDTTIFNFASYSFQGFQYSNFTGCLLAADIAEIYLFAPN